MLFKLEISIIKPGLDIQMRVNGPLEDVRTNTKLFLAETWQYYLDNERLYSPMLPKSHCRDFGTNYQGRLRSDSSQTRWNIDPKGPLMSNRNCW